MDNSSINGLIYQAVYITIFIVAVSITINLFRSINDYVDAVSGSIYDDSITDAVSENELLTDEIEKDEPYIIDGYELYSLVNNYGMYISENNYEYGAKYNKKLKTLKYKVKVYVKDEDGNYIIASSTNKIDLLKKYKKVEENFSENYIEFAEI